ncbi:MAG: endolytic transglycosylase MltG [Chloroflexota bacterium]
MKNKNNHPRNRSIASWGCFLLFVLSFILAYGVYQAIPIFAVQSVGPSSDSLGSVQKFKYAALMLWYDGLVTRPLDSQSGEVTFTINKGDGAATVAVNLERQGIILSADAFTAYLVYAGLDTGLQAGDFQISPAMAPLQIAQKLQDATPAQVKFVVLPGWRLEEVANAMPTSGLNITPDQFLEIATSPHSTFDFLPSGASAEGFIFPTEYILPRTIQADQLVSLFMNNAALALSPEMRSGFARQNLSVFQAVILASIIQREAIHSEEQPTIASVFLNRLNLGMNLETDPTIQYALGFNAELQTWWKVPLSVDDLAINSPYNTYLNPGLPPGPISNPGLRALQAVAYPAQTPYFFFRARCDGSGLHNFSETFEQHLQNGC